MKNFRYIEINNLEIITEKALKVIEDGGFPSHTHL